MTATSGIGPLGKHYNPPRVNELNPSRQRVDNLCTIIFPERSHKESIHNPIAEERRYIYPFPRCRAVIRFTSDEVRQATLKNIKMIEHKDEKLKLLEEALSQGNWDHPIFNLTNETLKDTLLLEFPLIALYGVRHCKISRDDYFLIQSYYGLRTQYRKEDIQGHVIFNSDGSVNETTKDLLKNILPPHHSPFYASPEFSKNIINRLTLNITNHENRHQFVIFSVVDPNIQSYVYINQTIWQFFYMAGYGHFENDVSHVKHCVEVFNLSEQLLRLYRNDGFIKGKIHFLEDRIINISTLEIFKHTRVNSKTKD
jgi:hypothetical protein